MRDLIVIGGGLAGLTAAYRMRHRDVLLLESGARFGGRVMSHDNGGVPLNLGAHMFSGPGTPVGDLLDGLGLTRQPIKGRLMGMAVGDALLSGRPELWPLRLPLSPLARLSFVRMGLRLRWGAQRMAQAIARDPDAALAFEDHRTLAQFMGPLHPKVADLLAAITERSGGDPSEMSAGHALRSFTNVWSGQAPGANLKGGSSRLIEAMVQAIDPHPGQRLIANTPVRQVRQHADHVEVDVSTPTGSVTLRAAKCIVATPAPVTCEILPDLPADTAHALRQITYGTFLSVALSIRAKARLPWQGTYAVSTPFDAFSVLFDQSTGLSEQVRDGRSSLMLFRGASGARALADHSDETLSDMARTYLSTRFPTARFEIEDIQVGRWPMGAPVARPGRATLQPVLLRSLGRVALAGDYMESPNMNAAIAAADSAIARLGLSL